MTRTDAISQLLRHADAIKAMGATSLYLFGSTARNEAAPDSDLDLQLVVLLTANAQHRANVGIALQHTAQHLLG